MLTKTLYRIGAGSILVFALATAAAGQTRSGEGTEMDLEAGA